MQVDRPDIPGPADNEGAAVVLGTDDDPIAELLERRDAIVQPFGGHQQVDVGQ